jgi:uncharacterized protein YciI
MEDTMRFVTLFDHGPRWARGRSIYQQGPVVGEHLESMRRLYDAGTLLLGGPFDDQGGVAVLEVADLDEAVRLMDADPAVRAGVLSHRLHRLHAYFDAFDSTCTGETVAGLEARRRVG